MYRNAGAVVVMTLGVALSAQGANWRLGPRVRIHDYGTAPCVWSGTVVYTAAAGGPLMFFDGVSSTEIYSGTLNNYEPVCANGIIAWRRYAGDVTTNEVYRWNGQTVVNISNSPGISDVHIAVGSNGDVMWSRNRTDLMYYTAATGVAAPLGVRGRHPTLYIAPGGTRTYAYQDPDTLVVKYFDGTTTHILGPGVAEGAYPSLWDGAVAWVGVGLGSDMKKKEIFFWKAGQLWRVTNDDAVNGVPDDLPRVWNDLVIWSRSLSTFAQRLFLWDGTATMQLTTAGGRYPSFHGGRVAWTEADGLYLARLVLPGDLNCDYRVDADDIQPFYLAWTDPAAYAAAWPDCAASNADMNNDGVVDNLDVALFWQLLGLPDCNGNWVPDDQDLSHCDGSPWCQDCNGNGLLDQCDIAAGTSQDANGNGVPDECETVTLCAGDMNCDGTVTFADVDGFVEALGGQAGWESNHPDCPWLNADCNGDGDVTFADTDPFVARLGTDCR